MLAREERDALPGTHAVHIPQHEQLAHVAVRDLLDIPDEQRLLCLGGAQIIHQRVALIRKQRAQRRCLELEQRGTPKPYDEVLRELNERDYNDSHRAAAPLRAAEDAIVVDTSALDFDASREALLALIRERLQ